MQRTSEGTAAAAVGTWKSNGPADMDISGLVPDLESCSTRSRREADGRDMVGGKEKGDAIAITRSAWFMVCLAAAALATTPPAYKLR